MKYDIRLTKLGDAVYRGELVNSAVSYSNRQAFSMGGDLVPLVQAFLSNLMIDPDSDITSPGRGGGLAKLARRHSRVSSDLEGEIRKVVDRVVLFMQNEQETRTMEPQERLKAARVVSVTPGSSPDEVNVQILVQAESGDVLQLTI